MGGISGEVAAVAAVGSARSRAPTGCHLEVFGCDSVSLERERGHERRRSAADVFWGSRAGRAADSALLTVADYMAAAGGGGLAGSDVAALRRSACRPSVIFPSYSETKPLMSEGVDVHLCRRPHHFCSVCLIAVH